MLKFVNRIPVLVSEKEVRDGRRYKQRDIANGTALSESMISRLMREPDISGVNYASARIIAEWLGVSTDDLAIKEQE
jgi:transcriptional regulator with XRE-family HTH domain